MNVRDLLDVRVICETGSLRKAATVLGVTQPTLSNRVAHLEDQLGAALFDRSRGQSQPTDLALFISKRAAQLANDAAQLVRESRRVAAGKGGVVRIGLGPAATRLLIGDIVARIGTDFPELSLEVVSSPGTRLAESLLNRDLDVAVCPPFPRRFESIESEPLYETRPVIVAHPDHPACTDPPRTLPELFCYPLAMAHLEQHYYDFVRNEYGVDIATQPGRVVCSDVEVLNRLVSASPRLLTFGPLIAFASELAAGTLRVVPLSLPFVHRLELHTNRDAYPLPAVTRVHEIIRAYFSNLQGAEASVPEAQAV